MSDESDETRSFSPLDETDTDGRPVRQPELDETRADGPAVTDDATKVTPRVDATSVMPPAADDDWAAPSRGNPVWSGRAEVRPPQPGRTSYDTDWQTGPAPLATPRDRWWMPIVVGIVVLILLAALGWGIYLIVQNSGDETPATTPTTTAATTVPTSAAATTPSSEPTTTTPSTTPQTTEPTQTEVLVPALKGLALDDARDALNQTGLRYRVLYRDSTSPPGTVIDSDPAEGQEVPPDTRVTIVVSGKEPSTATPSTAASAGG
jgi:PASTA domain-containing protein